MNFTLTEPERSHLRALQKPRRHEAGCAKATVVLLSRKGWAAGTAAEALSLDDATVYRSAQAYRAHGLTPYLAAD